MLEKVILVAAHAPSYAVGAKLLEVVGEIGISSRQLNNLTAKIGTELAGQRDASVAAYVDQAPTYEYYVAIGIKCGKFTVGVEENNACICLSIYL